LTPDVQAAAERVRAFLAAFEDPAHPRGAISTLRSEGLRLTAADLRTVLAALDPAETRTEWATRQRWPSDGTEQITDPVEEWLARRRVTQYPAMHPALMHRRVSYGPWIEGEPEPAPTTRHAPLTDEPCGVIPTPAGTTLADAYRAHRTEQRPRISGSGPR